MITKEEIETFGEMEAVLASEFSSSKDVAKKIMIYAQLAKPHKIRYEVIDHNIIVYQNTDADEAIRIYNAIKE